MLYCTATSSRSPRGTKRRPVGRAFRRSRPSRKPSAASSRRLASFSAKMRETSFQKPAGTAAANWGFPAPCVPAHAGGRRVHVTEKVWRCRVARARWEGGGEGRPPRLRPQPPAPGALRTRRLSAWLRPSSKVAVPSAMPLVIDARDIRGVPAACGVRRGKPLLAQAVGAGDAHCDTPQLPTLQAPWPDGTNSYPGRTTAHGVCASVHRYAAAPIQPCAPAESRTRAARGIRPSHFRRAGPPGCWKCFLWWTPSTTPYAILGGVDAAASGGGGAIHAGAARDYQPLQ